MPEVIVKNTGKFKILYNLPKDINTVVVIGGRGGRKTYEVSKFVAVSATSRKKRCVILRDEKELVRESILNEILLRYDTANCNNYLSQKFDRLDSGIKSLDTNEMMVFTKGFRASRLEQRANLKSISNIDIAVVEEAEDIRDETKFNTFADSIRKEGALIIIILNTPDILHWIIKRFFHIEQVTIQDVPELKQVQQRDLDGYYKLVAKELPGILMIQTGFEDNPFLPDHIISNYRNYGNPESHLYNLHYYLTAIKGFASTGRKGQILSKVRPIKLKDYLELPYREQYGQDFGTSSPAGFIGFKVHRNSCWARELSYKPMDTLAIGKMYCTLKISTGDRIIADSADEKACTKLSTGWSGHELDEQDFITYPGLRHGFNIIRARKGPDSIDYGLQLMTGMNLFAVEESINLWSEINAYIYAQDKWGNYTNDPVDDFNHLIDPWRYGIMDHDIGSDNAGMERVN